MTAQNSDNTTAGAPAAENTPHITVEGFDSLVPVVIDLDSPRDGVPLVIETQAGLQRCAAAIAAGTGRPVLMQNGPRASATGSARSSSRSAGKVPEHG
jgi:hypothetical protein